MSLKYTFSDNRKYMYLESHFLYLLWHLQYNIFCDSWFVDIFKYTSSIEACLEPWIVLYFYAIFLLYTVWILTLILKYVKSLNWWLLTRFMVICHLNVMDHQHQETGNMACRLCLAKLIINMYFFIICKKNL